MDGFLIRPGCLAGAAWLLRPLPGGVWLGFVLGKAAADVAWYGLEASARRGVAWSAVTAKSPTEPVTPDLSLVPCTLGRSAFSGYPAPVIKIMR